MATSYVIKNKKLKPIPQEDDATCWLAAYQMMFDWKGKSKDSIQFLLPSAVSDAKACYKKGLDKSDWGMVARVFGLTSQKGTKPFSASDLAGYIKHGPVLVHGKFPLGMHSIVVTGVSVADSAGEDDQVTYINPYWTGTKEVFARTSSFKLYVKIGVENNNGVSGVIQYWS
jgi:hypothetical protein